MIQMGRHSLKIAVGNNLRYADDSCGSYAGYVQDIVPALSAQRRRGSRYSSEISPPL